MTAKDLVEARMCVPHKLLNPAILIIVLVLAAPVCASAQSAKPKATPTAAPAASATAGGGSDKLQRRIDFGNSYILGQSIKSGAVYLLHRKKSEIKSMLHYRENYRDEILESFSVDADNELGQDMGQDIATEALTPMTKKTFPMKKTVLK
jgi:hypothetical protein